MIIISKIFNYYYLAKSKISETSSDLWNYFYIKAYLFFALFFLAANWYVAYFIYSHVSQKIVVLHYNINFGVDLVGQVREVFIIPATGTLILLFNSVLLSIIFSRNIHFRFLGHILLGSALIVNLLLLAGIGTVYLINFR